MESFAYFLLFAGLIFLMMRFGCGAHVMGHGHRGSSATRVESDSQGRLVLPAKDTDPVCGMTVEATKAKSRRLEPVAAPRRAEVVDAAVEEAGPRRLPCKRRSRLMQHITNRADMDLRSVKQQ